MAEELKNEPVKGAESKSSNWWQTMPGVLTAIAGMITAIAGLVAALHQTGLFSAPQAEPAPSIVTASPPDSPSQTASPSQTSPVANDITAQPNGNSQALVLPAGMEVKLPRTDGEVVYKILSAQLEPFNTENNSLKFTVRCTANTRYDASFGSHLFRLLVDDVPQAPINMWNEVVNPQSAKEGEIIFTIPISTQKTTLKIGDPGQETTEIPFDLTTK
jgi:hypothetical protein